MMPGSFYFGRLKGSFHIFSLTNFCCEITLSFDKPIYNLAQASSREIDPLVKMMIPKNSVVFRSKNVIIKIEFKV